MERSFKKEVRDLQLGDGDMFHGEGILAITKALLQAGVSYVGGYQGAPVSHLMDVLADAHEILDDLGVHFEACANEAAAAAMLGASINYPMRGAAVWKSTVGTNVASDALSNLASAGVKGGAVIVLGEDYGEGASIIQERSHAFAMKSQIWLLDPRPHLPTVVNLVERAFELSEVSNTPVMIEFRIRACHMHGRFATRDNRRPLISRRQALESPDFDYNRICLPPATYAQERQKIEERYPAAVHFIAQQGLNEFRHGDHDEIGMIMQGGLFNSVVRALQQLEMADIYGRSPIPLAILNVTYPLVPEEITDFCATKRSVLIVEEGQPAYLEQAIESILRKADIQTKVFGKDILPMAGEYVAEVLVKGVARYLEKSSSGVLADSAKLFVTHVDELKSTAAAELGEAIPPRPPTFCTGCPERPVFSAIKLLQRELGEIHVSADIGCHTFSTLPPFNLGNSVLGYGLGLASSAAVDPAMNKRTISIMGDGGFWHNGLSSGISGAVFNRADSVLVIMNNGYSSATGQQFIPSTQHPSARVRTGHHIKAALKGVGVRWVRTRVTYQVKKMVKTLRKALTTTEGGLKVIIAESECQLARQRRLRPQISERLRSEKKVISTRFGIDHDTCTGDHSCIRLSGCPSLTIKPNPDPLREDPVATVVNSCVGCGLCGEVSHAAILCPSFYRAERLQNAGWLAHSLYRVRRTITSRLSGKPVSAS